MIRSITLICCLIMTVSGGFAQSPKPSEPEAPVLTLEQFNIQIDRSIAVLKTKAAIAISDHEHIAIMRCVNTITYTIDNNRKRIYTEGRYKQLEEVVRSKNYMKEAMKVFPDCIPNKSLGVYFPKLKMDLYGTPSAGSMFRISS